MVRLGHEVVFGYEPEADAVLVNAFVSGPHRHISPQEVAQVRMTGRRNLLRLLPVWLWWNARGARKGAAIVHRVDGVTALYGRKTPGVDRLQVDVNRLTDLTVFQSEFCKQSFYGFGMRPQHSVVINNGVSPETFYPAREQRRLGETMRLMAVSWSHNPMKGFSTLAEISRLPNVCLSFIGNWPDGIDPGQTELLGVKRERELADLLRDYDAFVHAAVNDPSSNAIIEALASGLPVLYTDSGGNPELVRDCGLPIGEDLHKTVAALHSRYQDLRMRVLANRQRLSIEHVANQYINAICEAVDRRRESLRRKREQPRN